MAQQSGPSESTSSLAFGALLESGAGASDTVSPSGLSHHSSAILDEYAANPEFQELQEELRSTLFAGANTLTSPRHVASESRRVSVHETSVPELSRERHVQYLANWTSECAPWLDRFDQHRHFGIQVPFLARTSAGVLYALLALSARQIERHGSSVDRPSYHSLSLYSEAISSLGRILDSREPSVMVTACILCVLEMMSVSPRSWRRHLEGCASLFQAAGVNGFSGGLLQAVFWCYARMDLCAAIIDNGAKSTVLPLQYWALMPGISSGNQTADGQTLTDAFLHHGRSNPDMHANYMVYLCAQVFDVLTRRTSAIERGEVNDCRGDSIHRVWRSLWLEIRRWYTQCPPVFRAVKTVGRTSERDQFPRILYAHWAAMSSNQLYHTACIVMLEMMPSLMHVECARKVLTPLWHARRVVGISLSNDHRGCLNNAIQPLYIAGKLFTHQDEHMIIAKLLGHIESSSGWGSAWRIKDLEAAWGYKRGTFG